MYKEIFQTKRKIIYWLNFTRGDYKTKPGSTRVFARYFGKPRLQEEGADTEMHIVPNLQWSFICLFPENDISES